MDKIDFVFNPESLIDKLVEDLSDLYPYCTRVVLFGSLVKGSFNINSDIDILVVSENNSIKSEFQEVLSKYSTNFGIPYNLIFMSKIKYKGYQITPLISEIEKEGIVVWEKEKILNS